MGGIGRGSMWASDVVFNPPLAPTVTWIWIRPIDLSQQGVRMLMTMSRIFSVLQLQSTT